MYGLDLSFLYIWVAAIERMSVFGGGVPLLTACRCFGYGMDVAVLCVCSVDEFYRLQL
jgi:hypothetical protein